MINGVEYSNCAGNRVHLFIVLDLSDEFKELIRSRFVSVCQGVAYYEKWEEISPCKDIMKDFLERYEVDSEEKKKGLIGELLAHILISAYLENLKPVTPFFNMEDRGPRKGFDLVLFQESANAVWHVEVKSGSGDGDSALRRNNTLLSRAKTDLVEKLRAPDRNHWHNAIKSVKVACASDRSLVAAVGKILQIGLQEATRGTTTSASKNAALVTVLYKQIAEKIQLQNVEPEHTRIMRSGHFNDLIVVSIQKSTYDNVYRFIKAEVEQ